MESKIGFITSYSERPDQIMQLSLLCFLKSSRLYSIIIIEKQESNSYDFFPKTKTVEDKSQKVTDEMCASNRLSRLPLCSWC